MRDKAKKKIANAAYRKLHKERLLAQQKEYHEAHKEEVNARQKAWRLANKEKIKAYNEANKEKAKAYAKAWHEAHKKPKKERVKVVHDEAWYEERREKARAYSRAHYHANIDKMREQSKAYMKARHKVDPDNYRAKRRKRKALKYGYGHVPYKDTDIFNRDGWLCGLCGRKINKRLKHPNPFSPSIDHIIPLSRGGADAPVNVQAAHLRCNLSKNAGDGGQLRLFG